MAMQGMNDSREKECILPWVHLLMSPNGKIYSCCQTSFKKALGSTSKQSLKDIWSGVEFNNLRIAMSNVERVEECSRCYLTEKIGQTSLRLSSKNDWNILESLPDQPIYLDLRFDNNCNLKCRTCGPIYSSAWREDAEAFFGKSLEVESNQNLENSWNEIVTWLPRVKRINFAGGEPLLSSYHMKTLEVLLAAKNTNVDIRYATNFTILPKKMIEVWKKFSNISIRASVDGIGEVGEFIRRGHRWATIEENRIKLADQCPHIYFGLDWTLSIYNVFHLPFALKYFFDKKMIKSIDEFALNLLTEPQYLRVTLLNKKERENLRNLYRKSGYEICQIVPKNDRDKVLRLFSDIITYVESSDDQSQRLDFKIFNRKLDAIRGERSSALFPDLHSLI